MSGVFRNIDPPPHHRPASVYPPGAPLPLVRGEDTLAGWREGGGGSIVRKTSEFRHCSVLYICKYFVVFYYPVIAAHEWSMIGQIGGKCPILLRRISLSAKIIEDERWTGRLLYD